LSRTNFSFEKRQKELERKKKKTEKQERKREKNKPLPGDNEDGIEDEIIPESES
jgi:hypothetical protein